MPYLNIWIHAVWSTKDRAPVLLPALRQNIFSHINENGRLKGIHMDIVNGHMDHVHCLFSLTAQQNIATIVRLLKGESSHWVNQQRILPQPLRWQDDYFAVSVSESGVTRA